MLVSGNVSGYLPLFIHHHLQLPMPEATFYSSISSTTTCVVIFAFIFLSLKLNHNLLMYTNFALLAAGHLLMIYVHEKSWKFILALFLMGFGASSTYPLLLAFIEKRITVSSTISALTFFSCAIIISFNPILFGERFEKSPLFFMYVNLTAIISATIVFIFMHSLDIWMAKIRSKYEHISNEKKNFKK